MINKDIRCFPFDKNLKYKKFLFSISLLEFRFNTLFEIAIFIFCCHILKMPNYILIFKHYSIGKVFPKLFPKLCTKNWLYFWQNKCTNQILQPQTLSLLVKQLILKLTVGTSGKSVFELIKELFMMSDFKFTFEQMEICINLIWR